VEVGDLCPDIRKVAGGKVAHLAAGVPAVLGGKGQERTNFPEGEPELAGNGG
jgi:hypothetical protein